MAFRSPKRHGDALQITQTERKSLDDVGSPQEVELSGISADQADEADEALLFKMLAF